MRTNSDIKIRPYADDDADELAAAIIASQEALLRWMPWVTADYGPVDAFGFIRRTRTDGTMQRAIIQGGAIIGGVGVNQVDLSNGTANLGYWVRTNDTGRGVATIAARLMAVRAAARLDLHRYQITMSVQNEPSRRVAERLGAHYEGIAREALLLQGQRHDAHVYSLLTRELNQPK